MPEKPETDPSAIEHRTSDPDAPTTLVIGIAGAVFLFAIIVLLQALYESSERSEFRRKVVEEKPQELQSLRAEQLGRLAGYRWVDPKAGIVAIPVERAMDLIVEEDRARRRGGGEAGPER